MSTVLMKIRRSVESFSKSLIALTLCTSISVGAELPVRTVVLYKHGVGYFERGGTLAAGETARLDFKAGEMNDVLKSLTISDAGGNVKGLRYDSSIPLEEKLNEFPFRIDSGQPLSAVLDQLKGARIEMEFGPQKTAGEIVSARMIPGDKDRGEREQLTLLMDSGELRNVDLAAATSIRFSDGKLQLQFRDYLAALSGARSKDKRSLYIDSTDSKSRDVRATYIMPMPAWKSLSALLQPIAPDSTLEGWAIVDNTTGEDWSKVRISLVSGKPISFISQLYEPRFIARKEADLPEEEAVAPKVYSGAVRDTDTMFALNDRTNDQNGLAKRRSTGTTLGGIAGGVARGYLAPTAQSASVSSIRETAAATEIADLFEYSIREAVTVKKNESAMLPFLQQKITARKLIIYSDTTKANPLNAAELINNTGKTLDGGPITVYDDGAYAGEALVETVKTGDKRFISYGVDLGTRITTALDSRTDDVREVRAHNGMLTVTSSIVGKKTYSVKNVDARAKTLIIEHPVRALYKLIDTQKPSETARDVYRFEVKVPASGQVSFPVTEENVYSNAIAISSLSPDMLVFYVRNRLVSDAARRQFQAIIDQKQKIADLESEKKRLDADTSTITKNEERLRQNIASLSAVSGQQQLVQDYARNLASEETAITSNRDRETHLEKDRAVLQGQLNTMIERLNF